MINRNKDHNLFNNAVKAMSGWRLPEPAQAQMLGMSEQEFQQGFHSSSFSIDQKERMALVVLIGVSLDERYQSPAEASRQFLYREHLQSPYNGSTPIDLMLSCLGGLKDVNRDLFS